MSAAMPLAMGFDPFAIMSAFFLHVGARNIQFDFTAAQRKLLSMPVTRLVVLFAMFYVSTRSLVWSLSLVGIYFLLTYMLLNENHPLNVLSRHWLQTEGFVSFEKEVEKSPYELYMENLQHLNQKTP